MKREEMMSEYREGIKCQVCGEKITQFDFLCGDVVKAEGGCKGSVIYGHKHCCEIKEYSHEQALLNHKKTYSGFQCGLELESNSITTYEQRLQLFSWYKLIGTRDCTVEIEFKSPIIQGLHGIKFYLEGVEKVIDISSGENCGTHANVSLNGWSHHEFVLFTQYANVLFAPLAKAIKALPLEKRVEIFGRDFGGYRSYTEEGFFHGDWLQIKDDEGTGCCLEFRISRFRNVTQYAHLLMLYKEFCLILDKEFLKNGNPFQASRKMLHALKKHAEGEATYQKRERNK